MKILVLGHSGQLGQEVTHQLAPQYLVSRIELSGFDAEKDNIADAIPENERPDIIVNCLAYTDTGKAESEREKCFQINSFFPFDLATYCREHNIPLFHISTDYVFDGAKREPYRETERRNPLSIYALSKMNSEFLVMNTWEKSFIFRTSSLYGAYSKINFVENMLKKAREGKKIQVVSDQIMAPTHSLDLARTITHFIANNITDYGLYHFTNKGECSWYQFAQAIFEEAKVEADLEPTTFEAFPGVIKRPQYSVLNTDKIEAFVNLIPWRDALKEYFMVRRNFDF